MEHIFRHFRHIPIVLATALTVACSSGIDTPESLPETREEQSQSVVFDAYAGRITKASPADITGDDALAELGFAVYAYDQGNIPFNTYCVERSRPNFIYNQQVTRPATTWEYEPVKYYNNNPGALHSFFAYAPYRNKDDMKLAIGRPPQVRYEVKDDIDMLWSKPVIDMYKPAVTERVTFHFFHALSKVTFHVAPFIDKVHSSGNHNTGDPLGTVSEPLAEGTTIRVRNIRLVGNMPASGYMNTATGEWITDEKLPEMSVPHANRAEWVGDGTTVPLQYYIYNPLKYIPAQELRIVVDYDVITASGTMTSHVTNNAVSQELLNLEQGKAYNLFLDLGLTSVKFTAQVVDWDIRGEVPPSVLWIETITCTIAPYQDVGGSLDAHL